MTFQGEEDLKETPAPALPHKQRDHAARLHAHSSLHPGNSVLSSGSKISTTLFCLLQPRLGSAWHLRHCCLLRLAGYPSHFVNLHAQSSPRALLSTSCGQQKLPMLGVPSSWPSTAPAQKPQLTHVSITRPQPAPPHLTRGL